MNPTAAIAIGVMVAFLAASVVAWLLVRSGNGRLERYDDEHPVMRPDDWPWDDAS